MVLADLTLLLEPLVRVIARVSTPLILGGIVGGTLGKYVYDYAVRYFKARDKDTVAWDTKGFLLTGLISVILAILMYGYVFERVQMLGEQFLVLSTAAQVGFFWQSILGELAKHYE